MKNKYLRYILGFILLGLVILSFYNYWALLLFSLFFIIISMIEYRNMFKSKEIYPHKVIPELTGFIMAYCFIENYSVLPVFIIGCIFSFILTVIRNKKPYILTSLSTITAIFFILCGLYIIKLVSNTNIYFVLVYFAAVLAGDFAASKVGLLNGKTQPKHIAPEISPNKTLKGSIANLIITCMISLFFIVVIKMNIYQCLIAGIVISFFSQLGDLTVSSIKRDMEIKHSGTLFMDYGGIWDRIDAFIFSAPALYFILHII